MRKLGLACLVLVLSITGNAFAAGNGLTITVGVDASDWDETLLPCAGCIIIDGSGQINGNFTIADRDDGVQIGLRATDRTDGLGTPATGKKKGVYLAHTGFDGTTDDRAEWNYEWHVDLRNTSTTLADYDLTLTQTFAPKLPGLLNAGGPVDLLFRDVAPGIFDNVVLFQSSQNPLFFNDTFDADVEGTYNIKLTLAPISGGAPLIARIQVKVRHE